MMVGLSVVILHFVLGAAAAFAGTIPFGPINLSVVDSAIKRSLHSAFRMSSGAALVEILQSFLAYHGGMLVTSALASYAWLRFLVYGAFILIGVGMMLKKASQGPARESKMALGDYGRGALVGLLNPQAIPFWVFVFTYFQSNAWLDHRLLPMAIFLVGVTLGKFLALGMFALLGDLISRRAALISGWMNVILGSVFVFIGAFQLLRSFWG